VPELVGQCRRCQVEAAKLANNKTPRNPKNAADVQNMVFGKKGRKKVPLANTPIMYIYIYWL